MGKRKKKSQSKNLKFQFLGLVVLAQFLFLLFKKSCVNNPKKGSLLEIFDIFNIDRSIKVFLFKEFHCKCRRY